MQTEGFGERAFDFSCQIIRPAAAHYAPLGSSVPGSCDPPGLQALRVTHRCSGDGCKQGVNGDFGKWGCYPTRPGKLLSCPGITEGYERTVVANAPAAPLLLIEHDHRGFASGWPTDKLKFSPELPARVHPMPLVLG